MKISWKKYPNSSTYDEYVTPQNSLRGHSKKIGTFLESLSIEDLKEINIATEAAIKSMGISFRVYSEGSLEGQDRMWPLDFIPRLIRKSEWLQVEKGLKQRVKALNMFIEDCYNKQQFLNESDIDKSLVLDSPAFKTYCIGMKLKHSAWSHICGSDLIKAHDGKFYVLEDNLRVPSGVCYMLENRMIMKRVFPELFYQYGVTPIDAYPTKLYETLASVKNSRSKNPEIVLLTPGIFNSAYYEHSFLAQQMGIDLVEGRDLIVDKDGFVYKKTIEGLIKIDVIYRRVDDDYLDPEQGNNNSAIGVKGLIKAWQEKKVAIVNSPGCGIADDKAIYSFVPKMIRFYLNEEPIIKNIKTFILTNKEQREHVFNNFKEMVIKPVAESGGYGIVIGKNCTRQEKESTIRKVMNNPRNFVAQPLISLSTAPTYSGENIAPRHLDLRPFILTGEKQYVTVGGLTRVALKEGSTVVNSSQGGGSKDTWIV
ncbi:MAG: circularly permuted type 2 ATP-grasp protein [Gammaproteobacteria bacterium]|nr:MAG: circularly permuted type 2 ATP-grasp protein [Gammaproteobacteria bacterium]